MRRLFGKVARDKYHKGRVRTFDDAKALYVIDKRIAPLVGILNRADLISTIGSCQGHGFPFIKVPPYVSFKARSDIASALQDKFRQHSALARSNLHYSWPITTCMDDNSQLTYVLEIPELSQGELRYVTRSRIDQDLKGIGLFSQKILDHYSGDEVEQK